MSIEITVRHMDIGDDMQDYAREKSEAIQGDFPRVEHVHVILDQQKHLYAAEIVAQGRNHIRIEAECSSDDMRASLAKAFDKTERQLRKERDKVQNHKGAAKPD